MSDDSSSTRLPLLPLRANVLFPHVSVTLPIGRARSIHLVKSVQPGDVILTTAQLDVSTNDPSDTELYPVATYARVDGVQRRDGTFLLTLTGLGRGTLGNVHRGEHLEATATRDPDANASSDHALELAQALAQQIKDVTGPDGGALGEIVRSTKDADALSYRVAAQLGLDLDAQRKVLEEKDVEARLRLVAQYFGEAKTTAEVRGTVDDEIRKEIGKTRRESILREQLKVIQRELGEENEDDDAASLRKKIESLELPGEVRKVALRELGRLERMGRSGPEVHVIRTYLEWLTELPWTARAVAKDDIEEIEATLDREHDGLEEVKKRILEHMAVLKMATQKRGTILCLVGPPGVGKTSIAQSIASATGRPLVRVSLGGVRDEAEIRGHRRTYVGALPGRIITALRKVAVKNPLIVLDEIDKVSSSWAGSPDAALLELLDPEQNASFTDHYLELPFDLSEAMFVCTANTLETLSGPLRDRLEIVELSGYAPFEKLRIAKKHILPKRLAEFGIAEGTVTIPDATIERVIRDYTREAGVRQLDRQISKLLRSTALAVLRGKKHEIADAGKTAIVNVLPEDLEKHLGKQRFEEDFVDRDATPGVATGLAWTPFGGTVLLVETSRMPGKGNVEITGQLGDVMKESARAALTYVRSHAEALAIPARFLEEQDVHIHVPAGAVPKDGPSAGVTIFTALTSLFTGRPVRNDTAMTGEATLRGRVLPVGGIKAKVLAAHRAHMKRVIIPAKCERDLDELPKDVRDELTFFLVNDMSEVIEAALEPVSKTPGLDQPPPSLASLDAPPSVAPVPHT